jgi:peptide/nickel transport system permease protein
MRKRLAWSGAIGVALMAGLGATAILAPWIAPGDPFAVAGAAFAPPGDVHPFGTDDLGRDVFTEVVRGASTSLQVGLVAALSATLIGLVIGGTAGIRGGAVDDGLMRATEFVQAVPRFFLAVTIVSLVGGRLWLIVAIIGATAWPDTARLFRSQVAAIFGRDFVIASVAAGAGDAAILVRHVLPLTRSVIAAQMSYQAGGAILAEAGLSFLGLGDPTVVSWGTLLGAAHETVREAWWMSVFPGVAVTLTVLGCNLVADSLVRRTSLPRA